VVSTIAVVDTIMQNRSSTPIDDTEPKIDAFPFMLDGHPEPISVIRSRTC